MLMFWCNIIFVATESSGRVALGRPWHWNLVYIKSRAIAKNLKDSNYEHAVSFHKEKKCSQFKFSLNFTGFTNEHW